MAAWEYKVLVLPSTHYEVDEEILNLQGEQGWELVNLLFDTKDNRVAYFKRIPGSAPKDIESTLESYDPRG